MYSTSFHFMLHGSFHFFSVIWVILRTVLGKLGNVFCGLGIRLFVSTLSTQRPGVGVLGAEGPQFFLKNEEPKQHNMEHEMGTRFVRFEVSGV